MRSLTPAQAIKQVYAEDSGSAAGLHGDCFACGHGEYGLGLTFEPSGVDAVSAEWLCEERYQSYPGIVHGGVVATLLDSAMTNCLLIRGVAAVTAGLEVDYHEPLEVGRRARVKARIVRSRPPLFILEAVVAQGGLVKAAARGKFAQVTMV